MIDKDTRYLQPDCSAVSPLPDYPGTLRFPLVMTLAMHKKWQEFINGKITQSAEVARVGVAFVQDEGDGERLPFVYDDVELGLLFGKLELTGPAGAITEKTKADNLPLPVAVWVSKCYREWENSQLLFRWSGVTGMASQNGDSGHTAAVGA